MVMLFFYRPKAARRGLANLLEFPVTGLHAAAQVPDLVADRLQIFLRHGPAEGREMVQIYPPSSSRRQVAVIFSSMTPSYTTAGTVAILPAHHEKHSPP